jgi:alpha-mannosidase
MSAPTTREYSRTWRPWSVSGSGDVVVRLYESLGARERARLTWGFPVASVSEVDLLERPREEGVTSVEDGGASISLRPFQILTLRLARA